jgi:hypothetical protein
LNIIVPYPFLAKSIGLSTGIDFDPSKSVAKTGLLILYNLISKFLKKYLL